MFEILLALAILLLAAGVSVGMALIGEARARRRSETLVRLLALFAGPAVSARTDARELLTWYPAAAAARRLFPEAFGELDRATGGRFPFTAEHIQAAHARWTADWLTWERAHDEDSRERAAATEAELERRGELSSSSGRARLAALEREKLQRYQQRYEEYVRVSKALAALDSGEDA